MVLHTPNEMLVNLVPATRWGASESLRTLWKSYNNVWFGGSNYRFQWLKAPGEQAKVTVPGLMGLPAYMHAILRENKPRFGPVLAILVAKHLPGIKPFDVQTALVTELAERARERGVLTYVITPDSTMAPTYLEGYSLIGDQWVKQQLPYPDFVYNRYFGHQYGRRNEMLKLLKGKGALLINSSLPNKWGTYLWLKKNPLLIPHLPETRLYKSIDDIRSMLSRYPEVYLKPAAGARGTGIARLSKSGHTYKLISSSGQEKILTHLDRLPSYIAINSYIVQQGIRLWNYPQFYDFKVLVQNIGPRFIVTGKVARQAQSGRVTTHLHQGGEAVLLTDYIRKLPADWQGKVDDDINRVALEVAKVLSSHMDRLGEFSLDMGVDVKGRVWIIEVNGKPSRKSFRVAGDLEARGASFEALIDYILYDYCSPSPLKK